MTMYYEIGKVKLTGQNCLVNLGGDLAGITRHFRCSHRPFLKVKEGAIGFLLVFL